MDAEMIEHLKRHGFSDADVQAVETFEENVKSRKRQPRVQPEPLDFGDWE